MKILFVIRGLEIGGAENDVISLSQGLRERGENVEVLSGNGEFSKKINHGQIINNLKLPDTQNTLLHMFRSFFIIRRILKLNDMEIINPQSLPLAISCFLAVKTIKNCKTKNVVTIHMISSLKLYKYSRILNHITSAVIVESKCEKDRLIKGGVSEKIISIIHNCVDPRIFDPSKIFYKDELFTSLNIPSTAVLFGVIARLSPEKGHQYLIKAFSIASQKNPNIWLVIVGGGPLRGILEKLVTDLNLTKKIIFLGPRLDIPLILSGLDVFVLPSLIESLPLSIREAMAMGKPIISTWVGGIHEAVIDDENGLLVNPGDSDALSNAILSLANDRQKRLAFGKEGKKIINNKFNYQSWIIKTEELFTNIRNY